jgi:hypothetical protein
MAAGRFTYDPSNTIVEIDYMVAETGNPWFIAAYPQMFEEQRDEDEYFSENGVLSVDGTTRDLTTGVQWTEARFDAYKAAQLAQNNRLVGSTATGVVPATNIVTTESKGNGVEA